MMRITFIIPEQEFGALAVLANTSRWSAVMRMATSFSADGLEDCEAKAARNCVTPGVAAKRVGLPPTIPS